MLRTSDTDIVTCASLRRLGLDTGNRDREAETQPTLPGQGSSFPTQARRQAASREPELGKTAAEISVSLPAQILETEPGDSHGLPGAVYLLTRDWSPL